MSKRTSSRVGVFALAALIAVFAVTFCPCGTANAAITQSVQQVAAAPNHDCCNKTQPPCDADTCSLSSIETLDGIKAQFSAAGFSQNVLFALYQRDAKTVVQNVSGSTFDSNASFDSLYSTGPPIYIEHSLLLV